jgi:hypothetical protein
MQIIIDNPQPRHLDGDNIIAALEHPNLVCQIVLSESPLMSSLLERLATVMQKPFPVLKRLHLYYDDQNPPVLPSTFLGGSAPSLESLRLRGIPFPALPRLLLSAQNLVTLELDQVPYTGYISPEAMVTCLSTLTNLKFFTLTFQPSSSRPDRGSQHPLLLTRVDLPALIGLEFQGVTEYLEDFLVRINAPVINMISITFFNRVIFDIPQLSKFVSRIEVLNPESVKRVGLCFYKHSVRLDVHPENYMMGKQVAEVPTIADVRCDALDWKISFLVQICNQLSPFLSDVKWLDIFCEDIDPLGLQYDLDHTQWLEIFRPFIAVKILQIRGLDELIAPALQELTGERVMEVLPGLRSLFVTDWEPSGSVREAIEPFITARQLSNQPVTVQLVNRFLI